MISIELSIRAEDRGACCYRLLRVTVGLALTIALCAATLAFAGEPTTEPTDSADQTLPPALKVPFKGLRSARHVKSSTC